MSNGAMPSSANPAPLGLAGFGLTTVLLSSINAGLLAGDGPNLIAVVVPLAFAYGGIGQIIAGILEFRNGNTFGTVAFTSYGLFWWWYAFLLWTVGAGWLKAPAPAAVGVTLLLWGVFTLYMWIPTFRSNVGVWSVFLLLWITFFLLAAGDLGLGAAWRTAGGWLGLATGLDALYVSFAEVTNATFNRSVVPLGTPILKGSAALAASRSGD
ncbi:MAG TPA: acetate uptake transporter [Bryobacteraceae bacterium]|nr:acetate uptake transporter [Bryobacteraceae bacterium]